MIDQKVLIKLIDRLNYYPVGLPDVPEIREFLNLFLTEEEAFVASNLPLREVSAFEVSEKLNWSKEKANSVLSKMAEKGIVYDYKFKENAIYYILTPSVIGFVELSLMKVRPDMPMKRMAELLDEYLNNHLYKEVFGSETQISRALVEFDVPVSSHIKTFSQIEEIIRIAGSGAAQTCYCRHKQSILNKPCKIAEHHETCFSISKTGTAFIERRGYGRRIEAKELIERVKHLGEQGLIHVTDNIRTEPGFICNCCGCCCGLLSGITEKNIPHAVRPTEFILSINQEICTGCGKCSEKCQIGAIKIEGKKADLDEINCLGCGSCIKFCKKNSLKLVPRKKVSKIPVSENAKFLKIAWEKGKFFKLMWNLIQSKMW